MDAQRWVCVFVAAAAVNLGATNQAAAANYATPNFTVTAPTPQIAKMVGLQAEQSRYDLAKLWLGRTLPKWDRPCPIKVQVGQMGAGGATSFTFDRGEVFGWQMDVQGPLDRVIDSVVPHEVSHTIFASHFRRPLPRWADEGAATLAENESERHRQVLLVQQILNNSKRRIRFNDLLKMTEYPTQMDDVLTLYAEGYSLCDLLVQRGGRSRYLAFLTAAHRDGWTRAVQTHYGFKSVDLLEAEWEKWIIAGCPAPVVPEGQQIASNEAKTTEGTVAVIRSQSPETEVAASPPPRKAVPGRRGVGLEAPNPARNSPNTDNAEIALAGGAQPNGSRRRTVSDIETVAVSQETPRSARPSRPNDGWTSASTTAAPRAKAIPDERFEPPVTVSVEPAVAAASPAPRAMTLPPAPRATKPASPQRYQRTRASDSPQLGRRSPF